MRTISCLLLMLVCTSPFAAADDPTVQFEVRPDGSAIIQLTREQVVHCVQSDGCILMTPREILTVALLLRPQICKGKEVNWWR